MAKDKHHAFFGNANGKTILKRLIFTNDISGFNKLLSQAKEFEVQNGLSKTVFSLEPTGNYHKPLAYWLISNGDHLVLVSGKAVRDNRELLDGRWDKNDTKDSANVADLVSQGKCQFYEHPGKRISELRNLMSLRRRLKKHEHSLRMRIRNGLLAKFFPEMDRYWGNCFEENLAIVERCLSPQKISSMSFPEFLKCVTTTDRGSRQLRRLQLIYNVAEHSVGLPVGTTDEFEARMLVNDLRDVRRQVDQVMKQIEVVCRDFESYELLQTIPGFGPYIAALVLATIGDAARFKSRKQIRRLAGLDLCASRSGKKSDQAVPVISKKGNAHLRYALSRRGKLGASFGVKVPVGRENSNVLL